MNAILGNCIVDLSIINAALLVIVARISILCVLIHNRISRVK